MNSVPDFRPVLTKAFLAMQQNKSEARSDFKALVFEEPRGSAINLRSEKRHDTSKAELNVEFDMKKARHEVINYAAQNQRVVKNKKKMEIMQLVKLGAKPPKKAYKNYKELLAERKRLQQIRDERRKYHQLGKNQAGAASIKCRSKRKLESAKKKRAPVTDIDQHYGVAKPKIKRR